MGSTQQKYEKHSKFSNTLVSFWNCGIELFMVYVRPTNISLAIRDCYRGGNNFKSKKI